MDRNSRLPADNSKEISVKELFLRSQSFFKHLINNKKIIFLLLILGGVSGVIYSILTKPKYTGTLTFVLEGGDNSKLGGYSSIAAQFGLSLGGNPGNVFLEEDNIIAFMQSRSMLVKTLLTPYASNSNELLVDRYIAFKGYRKKWHKTEYLKNVKFYALGSGSNFLQDSLLNVFYNDIVLNHLSIGKTDKKSDLISINVTTPDEVFSKSFAENLLKNVSSFYIKTQTKKSIENLEILQHQTDSIRALLNTAIQGVAGSTDANLNLNPAYQRLRVPTQKRMVDVEMNKAILEELVKNLELARISLRKETPLVQVIDRPILPLYKEHVSITKGLIVGMTFGLLTAICSLGVIRYFRNALA